MKSSILNLLFLSVIVFNISACNVFERKSAAGKATLSNPQQPAIEKPKEELIKEEVIDFSWVPKYPVKCADKGCFSATPVVFSRPNIDSTFNDSIICLGYLIDKNTVITSRTCVPADVIENKATCKSRIYFKFPSVNDEIPEQGVGCESIQKISKVATEEIDKKIGPNYVVIKLAESVHRKFYKPIYKGLFQSGHQYLIAKMTSKEKSYDEDTYFEMSSEECATIENEKTDALKNQYITAFDCNLGNISGAPIFSNEWGGISLIGYIHSHTFGEIGQKNPLMAILNARKSYLYRLHFGINADCLNEDNNCQNITLDSFLNDSLAKNQDKRQVSANIAFEAWNKTAPLSSVIEWEFSNDLSQHYSYNKALQPYEQTYYVLSYPNSKEWRGAPLSSAAVQYRNYRIAAAIPKCIKATDGVLWSQALDSLDGLTRSTKISLSNYIRWGSKSIPDIEFDLSVPTWVHKEYEVIGSSHLIYKRTFKVTIKKSLILADTISLNFFSFSRDEGSISYVMDVPMCAKTAGQ